MCRRSRIHVTNLARSPNVVRARAFHQYYYRSNLWGDHLWRSPHFPLAYQKRPNPLDEGLQSLVLFYNAQPHPPWRNCAHGPYGSGRMDRETFRARRILVCQSHYLRETHRLQSRVFASAARLRRHYIFVVRSWSLEPGKFSQSRSIADASRAASLFCRKGELCILF